MEKSFSADIHIILLGYSSVGQGGGRHTNWYPWHRFKDVFEALGYDVTWASLTQYRQLQFALVGKRKLFICWNDPTSLELYQTGLVREQDIVLQKLTSLGKGMDQECWGTDPFQWCKEWSWPIHRTVEYLADLGLNIFSFGCRSISEPFPEKHRICQKLGNRLFWILWGGTPFDREYLEKEMKPVMQNLSKEVAFVGSRWGRPGRGNLEPWKAYIEPLLATLSSKDQLGIGGSGLGGQVSDQDLVKKLQSAKLCPIVHAASWQAEKGIQDRFWTVFMAGRFGVVDNEGVYDFFQPSEVVCEVDPEKWLEKSRYYLENVQEQLPYIEKAQAKIKTEYNWYKEWDRVLKGIQKQEEPLLQGHEYEDTLDQLKAITTPFIFLPDGPQ